MQPHPLILLCVSYLALVASAEENGEENRFSELTSTALRRIVGGSKARQGEFPWIVSMHLDGEHYCAGTIISENFILGAAHCKSKNIKIIVGEHVQSGDDGTEVTAKVAEIIAHEDFDPELYANDIALYRLTHPLKFTKFIKPAKLAKKSTKADRFMIAAGWGATHENNAGLSDILLKVKVTWRTDSVCEKAYEPAPMTYSAAKQICVGAGGKDSCQGDSGGPLHNGKNTGDYTVVGIVSYGKGCANKEFPTKSIRFYTKISAYADWIEKHMKKGGHHGNGGGSGGHTSSHSGGEHPGGHGGGGHTGGHGGGGGEGKGHSVYVNLEGDGEEVDFVEGKGEGEKTAEEETINGEEGGPTTETAGEEAVTVVEDEAATVPEESATVGDESAAAGEEGATEVVESSTVGEEDATPVYIGSNAGEEAANAGEGSATEECTTTGEGDAPTGEEGVTTGDEIITDGIESSTMGEEGSNTGEESAPTGEEGVTTGDEIITEGVESSTVGEEAANTGESVTTGGEDATAGVESSTVGDDIITAGEENATVGQVGAGHEGENNEGQNDIAGDTRTRIDLPDQHSKHK